jgi:O-antigen/teichoic acid export membrane protein
MSTSRPSTFDLGEPHAHVMMRHTRTLLRLLLAIAIVASIVLMVYFRPAAYLAAIPIPILLILYAMVSFFERQSRVTNLRDVGATSISKEELEEDVQGAGIYTTILIGVLFVLGAFVAAASIFDWTIIGIAGAVLLLLSLFYALPFLPIFVVEAANDERNEITRQAMEREEDAE